MAKRKDTNWIVMRGGGDLATGIAQKLHHIGCSVVILETDKPLAIRRNVALSEALYENQWTVEDITSRKARVISDIEEILENNMIPILADQNAELLQSIRPAVAIDAIIAKKNLGSFREMGRCGLIALGPGFTAGDDVDIVIETQRGHNLGRLIFEGEAIPNTGIPGPINGFAAERVIHAPVTGTLKVIRDIGSIVETGEPVAAIGDVIVPAKIDGVLRGMLRDGMFVTRGLKMADIDPRLDELENCFSISDKARNLGGSVLEAVLILLRRCGEQPW